MQVAALLIGLFMMGSGFVFLFWYEPAFFQAFLGTFNGLYVIAAARIGAGLVFLASAVSVRFPRLYLVLGLAMIALGVATLLVNVDTANAVLRWGLFDTTPSRAATLFFMILGTSMASAAIRRR